MRDVIVVGAGGGGPVVAKELAQRGLDVFLAEAGRSFDHPDSDWTKFENDANNPLDGYFRFGPGDRSKPAWYREWPQNSFLWQLAGVGGTTLHYYANCPRAYPGVFAGYEGDDAAAYDSTHRFPFTYEELLPYYRWVEATLPVQTAVMGTKEHVLLEGADADPDLSFNADKTPPANGAGTFRPQENAILQPEGNAAVTTETIDHPDLLVWREGDENLDPADRKVHGCTLCGYCFQGCNEPHRAPVNLKAKRSTNVSYVPMARTAGRWAPATGGRDTELRPDAFAVQVHTDTGPDGTVRARAVTFRDTNTGETFTEEAKVIVLAAGCTETPRLWLNSRLPNPNGWVGRGYTDHFFDWVVGKFDRDTGSSKGVGSSARCDFPGRGGLEQVGLPPALQAFSLLFSDSGFRGYYDNGLPKNSDAWGGPAGRIVGDDLKEFLGDVDSLVNLLVLTDDDVEAQNRVTLSTLAADEHGPVAKVEFHQRNRTPRTLANREFLARRAAALLSHAGATEIRRISWPPLILHVQSTMRMGLSDADSVLTDEAESRWVKGLYVADNSALANSLGGPNPTLTTQALATRTAEKIFQRHFGGEAWVGDGSGAISSASSEVTAAVIAADLDGR